jgi:tetratricopeptide (TPR) repeat protein
MKDAETYPEERGSILLEAVEHWRRAGDIDKAVEVLHSVAGLGSEDGELAQLELADLHFERGEDDEGHALYERLLASRPSSEMVYEIGGEILTERKHFGAALGWYNQAVSAISAQDRRAANTELGWVTPAGRLLKGRREVRKQLGLPPDADDLVAPSPSKNGVEALRRKLEDVRAIANVDTDRPRMMFWPRAEFAIAREEEPEFSENEEDYYPRLEARAHELANRGASAVVLVPGEVARLRELAGRLGHTVMAGEVHGAYLQEFTDARAAISWPPPRNAACWCGSGTKYKKCCGRPKSS